MTKNQIEYNKLRETQRANRATEELTTERDEAQRRLGLRTLQETARHNQQVELQARDNLAEQFRNNTAQLNELQRAHLASEGIAQQNADTERERSGEIIRHDATSEKENERHNRELEAISRLNTDINRLGVEVGATSRLSAAEISAAASKAAAAMAAGASQYASDNALLAKQMQVDLDRYSVDVNQQIRQAELDEKHRSNVAVETETNRANTASEQLRDEYQHELNRHNLVSEIQNQAKIDADIDLRGEANRISGINAETNRLKVDSDIALVPSQQFSNTARGIEAISRPLLGAIELFTGKEKH